MGNDALKIMDEISADTLWGIENLVITEKEWQSLRTAVEAERSSYQAKIDNQAEELAQAREWNRQMVEKAASGGTLEGYREMGRKLAQKDARIARLRHFLSEAVVFLCEFDMSDEDESLVWEMKEVLYESPRQSLAAVKAGALREYAEHKREQAIEAGQGARRDRCNRMASNAEAYAERIEQEAKDSP